jgi:hypothetical protein
MLTLGIDLPSQPSKTGAYLIQWSKRGGEVVEIVGDVDDELAVSLIERAEKVGIDIPLGWPTSFAEAVARHSKGAPWPADYRHTQAAAFQFRRTDRAVKAAVPGSKPLSVSADKIAIPAMRAAALLATITPAPPRDGSGLVVEVYPAAALRRWGFVSEGYKEAKGAEVRAALVAAFMAAVPWLRVSPERREFFLRSDHTFDAFVAALVARAAVVDAIEPIPPEEVDAALREGWIAIPTSDALARLGT